MPEEDDFAAQLASLDREQLNALMSELQDRAGNTFAFQDPNEPAPGSAKRVDAWGIGLDDDATNSWTGFRSAARQTSLAGRGYNAYKQMRNRKKDKKKKAAHAAAMGEEAARQQQLRGERLKSVQNQLQTLDLRERVNQQFQDLDLEGLNRRVTEQGLNASLGGISKQYEDLSRQGGFAVANKGLAGSSFDAERLADTQAAQQQDQGQAVAQAQMQFQNLNQQNDTQRRDLLASISGGNPGESARLGGEIANIQNQANAYSMNAGQQAQGINAGQTAMNNQSQALGGLLSTYARLYGQNNQTPR